MMERMPIVGYPGQVGRFRPEQIAQISTWTKIPEGKAATASMHVVHVYPSNGTMVTMVNPTDPGDNFYMERPTHYGRVKPAGRMRY